LDQKVRSKTTFRSFSLSLSARALSSRRGKREMKKKKPTLLSSREEEEEQRVVGVFATTKTTTRLFQFLNPIDSELHRLSTKIEAECFPLLREREIPIVAEDDDDEEDNGGEDFDDGVVKKTDATTADGVVSLLFLNRPRSVFVFVSDLC